MKYRFADRSSFISLAKFPQLRRIARHERAGHSEAQLPGDLKLIELMFRNRDAINGINPGNVRVQNKARRKVAQFAGHKDSLSRRESGY